MHRTSTSFMNGVPELLVLRLLKDREMYGYEIVAAIRERSAGSLAFGEGVIYPLLHALQRQRALASRRVMRDGRQRVYYRLTARGRKRLGVIAGDWHRVSAAVQHFLAGDFEHAGAL